METLIAQLEHWPWLAVTVILAIVGQVTSTRIFTRERAYGSGGIKRFVFFWGRESLPLHPIVSGFILAALWPNPEPVVAAGAATYVYFGSAGAASLFLWMWLKARAKAKGIKLELPGAS